MHKSNIIVNENQPVLLAEPKKTKLKQTAPNLFQIKSIKYINLWIEFIV